jgi:hypothetical protein
VVQPHPCKVENLTHTLAIAHHRWLCPLVVQLQLESLRQRPPSSDTCTGRPPQLAASGQPHHHTPTPYHPMHAVTPNNVLQATNAKLHGHMPCNQTAQPTGLLQQQHVAHAMHMRHAA